MFSAVVEPGAALFALKNRTDIRPCPWPAILSSSKLGGDSWSRGLRAARGPEMAAPSRQLCSSEPPRHSGLDLFAYRHPSEGPPLLAVDCQAQFSLRETDKARCRLSAVTNVPSACTADGLQVAFISAPSWAT